MKVSFNNKDMFSAVDHVFLNNTKSTFDLRTKLHEFAYNLMMQGAIDDLTSISSGGFFFSYEREYDDDAIYVTILVSPQFGGHELVTVIP